MLVIPCLQEDIPQLKPKQTGLVFMTTDTGRFYVSTRKGLKHIDPVDPRSRLQRLKDWFHDAMHRARP